MADGTPTNFNSSVTGNTLTKATFVEEVYSKVGLSRRDSADIIELLFESIKETLARGEAVKISGFGNFVVREKKARVGRNPRPVQTLKSRPGACLLSNLRRCWKTLNK